MGKNFIARDLTIFFTFLVFAVFLSISCSFAASTIYVNGTSGNNDWDGTSPIYTGGTVGPKATIQNGTDAVDPDGLVQVSEGTYQESIVIKKSLTLNGLSADQTIIDGNYKDLYIDISTYTGLTVLISNFTFQRAHNINNPCGIILNGAGNNLTLDNCIFINNSGTPSGGAITNYGMLHITKTQFTNNKATDLGEAGAIYNKGILDVRNSQFINNEAENSGGSIYNSDGNVYLWQVDFTGGIAYSAGAIQNDGYDAILTVESCNFSNNNVDTGGGAICNSGGNVTIINSIFANNSADSGGAIYNNGNMNIAGSTITENQASSGDGDGGGIENNYKLIIMDCNITNNQAIHWGGGICNWYGDLTLTNSNIIGNQAVQGGGIFNTDADNAVTLNFNRIVNNSPTAVENDAELITINALYNWWGSNKPDFPSLLVENGPIIYDPWLVLTYGANPSTIPQGATSTLTADFRYDSNGIFHNPINGHLIDGTPVTFTTNLGNVGSKSTVAYTLNGVATAILRGDEAAGAALTSATLDSQTLYATVTITPSAANVASTTRTIGMQTTGMPIIGLILAILLIGSGMTVNRKK